MAMARFLFILLALYFALCASFVIGNDPQTTGSSSSSSGSCWCVAKPSSDQATLLANINYACSKVDCQILQKGCPCFYPDTLINRASVAMNLYYQSRGRNAWSCDFRGSGLVVLTNPSYDNCIYA